MKLTKQELKQMIKEELEHVLGESRLLKKFSKSKENEFKQYLSDRGIDPDDAFSMMGPDQTSIIGGEKIRGYPQNIAQKSLDEILAKYGFTPYEAPGGKKAIQHSYRHRAWTKESEDGSELVFSITYQLYGERQFRYEAKLVVPSKYSNRVIRVANYNPSENGIAPQGLTLKNDEGVAFLDNIFIKREGKKVESILGEYSETN